MITYLNNEDEVLQDLIITFNKKKLQFNEDEKEAFAYYTNNYDEISNIFDLSKVKVVIDPVKVDKARAVLKKLTHILKEDKKKLENEMKNLLKRNNELEKQLRIKNLREK